MPPLRSSTTTGATASLLLGTMLVLSACQSNQSAQQPAKRTESAKIASDIEATAKVVAVDATARLVTLRREDGSQFRVLAGEAVRNFDRIAVGNDLRVRYREELKASILPAGTSATPATAALGAGRATPGTMPAAGVGMALTVRVKVESIDRERNILVCSLASGDLLARRVVTPEGKEFIKGLQIGETVQLDYAESLAISIESL